MKEKQKLLLFTDSLFVEFAQKTELKFKSGDVNILEQSFSEIQREQIAVQLKSLKTELTMLQMQFQLLLQSEIKYIPTAVSFKATLNNLTSDKQNNHPELQLMQQQVEISKTEVSLERQKLLPDLSFGFATQSMLGINHNRFNYYQLGLGIPLFSQGQRTIAKAAKSKITIAENEYKFKEASFDTFLQQSWNEYQNNIEIADNYEKKQLPKAKLILETSKKRLQTGDIDYLEWVVLTNQAVKIQSVYIESLDNLNLSIIELNYLTSN